MGAEGYCKTSRRALHALSRTLRLAAGFFLLSITLVPPAIAEMIANALSPISRKGMHLIRDALSESKDREELIIPSTVLHDAFSELHRHGIKGREWVVALGYQRIDEKCVVTHVYSLKCPVSRPAEAEPDYSDLSKALRFYESCGAQIAGFAHIHPWNTRDVAPSSTDIETHSRWEKFYNGRFIGIVFSNSGVFRIFHTEKCTFKPVITGKGVRKIGDDLYELEGACFS